MARPSWARFAFATIALCGVFVGGRLRHAAADDIPLDQSAGTIALISGKAWVRQGEITLPTPDNEGTVSPNIAFKDGIGRELGPNDHVQKGDVIVTGEDSYLKIYYRDDSIMDVAPNTTVKVSQFQLTPQSATSNRQITFTLLQGKVRTLVTRALDTTSFYRVETPTSSMGVHGTEWVTNSYPQNGQYRTDVTVLEGKVVVDMPKPAAGGAKPSSPTTNVDQVAVTPGHTYSAVGNGGSVSKYSVFKLSNDQVKELAAMVPNIETTRVGDITRIAPPRAQAEPSVSTGATIAQGGARAASATVVAAATSAATTATTATTPTISAGGARTVSFAASAPAAPASGVQLTQVAQQRGGGTFSGAAPAAVAASVMAANSGAAGVAGRSPAAAAVAPSVTATNILNSRPTAVASAEPAGSASLERPAGAVAVASAPPKFVPMRAHIQAPPAVIAPPVTSVTAAAARR